MLKALALPITAAARVVRRTVAPQIPPTPRQLFSFGDSCRGIVTSHTAHWISNAYSTGNVGYVDRRTGLMALPGVRTTQTHKQEFWIDGVHRYTLTNRTDIGITEGHEVSILADRGRIAYILNHSTRYWHWVSTLDDLLPPTSRPWNILVTLFLAVFIVPWSLGFLAVKAMPVLAGVLHALSGLPSPESLTAACLAVQVLFGVVGPFYALLWLFGRRRRAQRHQMAIYEQGRRELEAACRDGLGFEPLLPHRTLEFWGLWLGLPMLAMVCLVCLAVLKDTSKELAKPPAPPPPDYTAQLIGRWKTPAGVVSYAPDHTYTVTKATGAKVVESGTWSLDGTTLSYTVTAPLIIVGIDRGRHYLQRVDASTLVYTDPDTKAGPETWQRAAVR